MHFERDDAIALNLRDEVEKLLPTWESWYPSLFDAAVDLGVLKAQVCSPSSLLLSNRHSAVQSAAAQAHREQWGGVFQDPPSRSTGKKRKRRRSRKRGRR